MVNTVITYCGDRFIIYATVKSLCNAPETSIISICYATVIFRLFKKKKKYMISQMEKYNKVNLNKMQIIVSQYIVGAKV